MKIQTAFLGALAASFTLFGSTLAQADSSIEQDVKVLTVFPDNPFNIVKNGQSNRVVLSLSKAKGADRVLTLEGITGAYLNPKKKDGQKGRVLRNMTTSPFKSLPLREHLQSPLQVPFDLYPEFKPDDYPIELRLLITDGQTGKKHNHLAYRGTVKVIEPAKNYLDPSLLSVYLILALSAFGTIYLALQAFNKPSEKRDDKSSKSKKTTTKVSRPDPVPNKSNDGKSFDESWIPEEHLKKNLKKARGASASNAASSGDESINDSPAAAARRRHRK